MSWIFNDPNSKPAWKQKDRCPSTGKVMFNSKAEALYEIPFIAAYRRRFLPPRRKCESGAYECPYCGAWHLTSQTASAERKVRQ